MRQIWVLLAVLSIASCIQHKGDSTTKSDGEGSVVYHEYALRDGDMPIAVKIELDSNFFPRVLYVADLRTKSSEALRMPLIDTGAQWTRGYAIVDGMIEYEIRVRDRGNLSSAAARYENPPSIRVFSYQPDKWEDRLPKGRRLSAGDWQRLTAERQMPTPPRLPGLSAEYQDWIDKCLRKADIKLMNDAVHKAIINGKTYHGKMYRVWNNKRDRFTGHMFGFDNPEVVKFLMRHTDKDGCGRDDRGDGLIRVGDSVLYFGGTPVQLLRAEINTDSQKDKLFHITQGGEEEIITP